MYTGVMCVLYIMGTPLVHHVCVRFVVCVLVLSTTECSNRPYVFMFRVFQVKAGVESSTLPVGMELDPGLRTIAWGCCWSSPGGLPLSPPPVLRAGGAQ